MSALEKRQQMRSGLNCNDPFQAVQHRSWVNYNQSSALYSVSCSLSSGRRNVWVCKVYLVKFIFLSTYTKYTYFYAYLTGGLCHGFNWTEAVVLCV